MFYMTDFLTLPLFENKNYEAIIYYYDASAKHIGWKNGKTSKDDINITMI